MTPALEGTLSRLELMVAADLAMLQEKLKTIHSAMGSGGGSQKGEKGGGGILLPGESSSSRLKKDPKATERNLNGDGLVANEGHSLMADRMLKEARARVESQREADRKHAIEISDLKQSGGALALAQNQARNKLSEGLEGINGPRPNAEAMLRCSLSKADDDGKGAWEGGRTSMEGLKAMTSRVEQLGSSLLAMAKGGGGNATIVEEEEEEDEDEEAIVGVFQSSLPPNPFKI